MGERTESGRREGGGRKGMVDFDLSTVIRLKMQMTADRKHERGSFKRRAEDQQSIFFVFQLQKMDFKGLIGLNVMV